MVWQYGIHKYVDRRRHFFPSLFNACQVDHWQALVVKQEDHDERLLADNQKEGEEQFEHLGPERFATEFGLDQVTCRSTAANFTSSWLNHYLLLRLVVIFISFLFVLKRLC